MPRSNEDSPEKVNVPGLHNNTYAETTQGQQNDTEQFLRLVESMRDHAIFTTDTQGLITAWNPGVENILGYQEGEWIGQSAAMIFTPEDRAGNAPEEEMARARIEGRSDDIRWHLKKDGSRFWAEGSLVALYDTSGILRGFGKIMRDATARKLAEDSIAESERRFRAVFDQAAIGICHTDLSGRYILVNDRYCEMAGRTREELLGGMRMQDIVHPDDLAKNLALLERLIRSGEEYAIDKRQVLPGGTIQWVSNSVSLIHNADGTPRCVQALSQDITARMRTEEALRQAEAELARRSRSYSALVESATDSLVRYSRDLRFLFVNPAFERYTGFSREQVIGRTYREAGFPEESAAAWEPTLRQVFATGEPLEREVYLTRPSDGQTRVFERVITPEFDPLGSGEVATVLTFSRDITERKQAERRDRFLADLMERIRSIPDPEEVLYETVKIVGEFTRVNRCLYAEIDEDTAVLTVLRDFIQGDGVESIMGTYPLYSFGPPIVESLRAGNLTTSEDTEIDPRLGPEYRATFRALNFRSFLCVPLHKEGKWVAILVLHSATPRVWTREEAELLTNVAEQTWLAVENARLYRAMQDEVEERRAAERLVTEAYALERERAEREALLSNASRVLSASLDYQETLTTIARLIVPRFADWCGVDLLDEAGALQRVAVEHVDPDKAAWGWELHRRYPTRRDAPRGIPAVLRTGKSDFIPQITDEMITAGAQDDEHLRLLREIGFLSAMVVPLIAGGTISGALTFVSTQESGRFFNEEDLRLAEELGRRAALAIENARLFRETRLRAEREHLLNEISHAIRDADLSPDEIQARATALLGKALSLDRCYFALYDSARAVIRIGQDWYRDHLPSMTGEHPLPTIAENSPEIRGEVLAIREQTAIYQDLYATPYCAETRSLLEAWGLRALIGVVVKGAGGAPVASLHAAMADAPRSWTEGEIALVESVATLVRTEVESARLQQRERNIAQQLQDALQLPSPPELPGLSLAGFYKPALEEAGVGGDFWDVYPLKEELSVLCCGDLSGKGLAAASQVATVRNMVRLALYSGGSGKGLAAAITGLNRILVEHDLLTGFATLFIGVYDHAERTFTYVNCGQEPGLVWRAAAEQIEELAPTGPVLGGFGTGRFEQRTVTFYPGDVLALFTDGLTEVGPNRRELLEVEGVATLLQESVKDPGDQNNPTSIMRALIARVDGFARGGARDDVALLVGIVQQNRDNS
jgi:PAS domain S-box-containing protein